MTRPRRSPPSSGSIRSMSVVSFPTRYPRSSSRWATECSRSSTCRALLAAAFGVSTSEARRSLAQGGVRIDGEQVVDGALNVPAEQVDGKVLQLGKRRFARVTLV